MSDARSANEWRWWAAGAWFVVLVVSILPALAAHPRLNFDSASYLTNPSLNSGRLPVVPAVFALMTHDLRAIGIAQTLVGAFCWCLLLSEIARCTQRVVRLLALGSVVVIACSTYVVQWYAAILSDSISISLLVLVVGLLARWQRLRASAWPLVAACVLWAMTRPTNAYTVCIAAVILMPVALAKYRKELPKVACVLIVSLAGIYLAGRGQLWQEPFLHSITERVLPSPSLRGWFAGHGMPVTPALTRLSGPFTHSSGTALVHSPALHSFRSWMDRSGKTVFVEFMATHIGWVLHGTFSRHEELPPTLIAYYGGGVARPWYPAPLRNLFLSDRQLELLVLVGAAVFGCAARAARRTLRPARDAVLLWGSVIVLGFVTLAIDWAGDSWEVGRHSVDGTIIVALAAVMLLTGLGSNPSPPRAVESVDSSRGEPYRDSGTSRNRRASWRSCVRSASSSRSAMIGCVTAPAIAAVSIAAVVRACGLLSLPASRRNSRPITSR